MKRREFVAGCASVTSAGAVGLTRVGEFDVALDSSQSTTAGATGDDEDDEEAAAGNAQRASDGSAGGDAADEESATLEVLSTTSGPTDVRLRLVRVRDGAVVHDRVRSFDYGERAYLSGLCARGETYAFSLAVADTTLVQETIESGEISVYELLDETTVSVDH